MNSKKSLRSGKVFLVLNRISNHLLNILALLNILMFSIGRNKLEQFELHLYTTVIFCVIAFFWLTRIFCVGKRFSIINMIPDLVFVGVGIFVTNAEEVFKFYLISRQTYIIIRKQAAPESGKKFLEKLSENPPILVLYSFLLVIIIGSLLLLLPSATVKGEETTLLGAIFTSTSATCVTGLIVYDTGTHFTLFGQLIILLLIQIGGLGIMTISSAFALMLGQSMSLRSENAIQHMVGESNKIDMTNLIQSIVIITVSFELIGGGLLFITFSPVMESTAKAIYHSLFHSISAFCNAGFSLYANSFMSYRSSFNINFVITSLIIIGGIGFPVLVDIKKIIVLKLNVSRFSLHSKVVLTSTIILILLGTAAFFISEYDFEMNQMNLKEKLFSSYFQSVTCRTAGFNTIDNTRLSKGSILMTIILMFIGASPGSTGGGLKTTTFAIIFVAVVSLFRRNRDVNVFQRKVSNEIIRRVMALIALSASVLTVMIFLLLLLEPFSIEQIVFEAFSAFGTVGLSMGITPLLSGLGQAIIILLMYLGRVGLLTLIFALSSSSQTVHFSYTEEKIAVG